MNWLIIAPNSKESHIKALKEYLEKKFKIIPYEIFIYNNIPRDELFDDLKHITQATHCIILDAATVSESPDYGFILGILLGKQVRTFILEGRPFEHRYLEVDKTKRPLLRMYKQLDDLFYAMSSDYEQFVKEDKQRQALTRLFAMGVPFTSDCFAQYIAKDDTETCNLFFDAGMLVNARTSDGVPILSVAIRNDCDLKVQWLLENGADINAVSNDRGYSAVMDAVWRKNYSMTKYLIEQGADLNFISSDGQSILVLAVGNGNYNIVELLLESGADPDIKDSMGMSARGYANLFKKPGMVELMERFPPKK